MLNCKFVLMMCVSVLWGMCMCPGAFAQGSDADGVWLKLEIKDKFSKQHIQEPRFGVYRASDSTGVAIRWWLRFNKEWDIKLMDDNREGEYYLVAMAPTMAEAAGDEFLTDVVERQGEFESVRVPFTVKPFKGKRKVIELQEVLLPRKKVRNINLKEVEVKASKVMFYHKGDTLVYNADAFVLAQGSMLDALITQLPGVELKGNGEILVNGRRIEALLLNGKDLFNGKKGLMLDNLPAYTVKDIAVYDKRGRISELMGRDAGDMQHVMDVRLKREYRMGWFVNAEGGYGTHDRYLARLFGMWFSDNASVALHGAANNLSDASTPGKEDGAWSRDRMGSGVETRQSGGVTYTASNPNSKWEWEGSVDAVHHTTDGRTYSTTQDYLSSGDMFSYRWNNFRNRTVEISTSHTMRGRPNSKVIFSVSPKFSYSKTRNNADATGATFGSPQDSVTAEDVRDIIWGDGSTARSIINRNISENLERGDNLSAGASAGVTVKTKSTGRGNNLALNGGYVYDRSHNDRFNRYDLRFADGGAESAYKYFRNHPDHKNTIHARLDFFQFLDALSREYMIVHHTLTRTTGVQTADLFLLNDIAGFDSKGTEVGVIPTGMDYLSSIDMAQSYSTSFGETANEFHINGFKNIQFSKKYSFNVSASVDLNWYNRTLNYFNAGGNQSVHRCNFLPSFSATAGLSYIRRNSEGRYLYNRRISVKGERTPQKASLFYAVDRVDTADPLNILLGNPDIKDSYVNSVEVTLSEEHANNGAIHNMSLRYENMEDAIASGAFYNTATGVRTSRPYNVDGNRLFRGSYSLNVPLDRMNRLRLSSATGASWRRSVDLSGSTTDSEPDFTAAPPERKVNTLNLNEELKLMYTMGRHRLTFAGTINWRDYRSHDEGFSNFSAWNTNVGVSGVFNLPREWSVSTDLNLYTRRGYADSALNTSDVVWNARVSKSVLKGALVFAVDGYDLLQQLSNVTYTINAQARTETVSNVIPSYLLFHVCYRFNRNPGKK